LIFWNCLKVIVEKDNQIFLYCKGADTKIKERLADSQTDIINQTDEHLNVSSLFFLFYLNTFFFFLLEFCKW